MRLQNGGCGQFRTESAGGPSQETCQWLGYEAKPRMGFSGILDFAFSKIDHTCSIPVMELFQYEVLAQLDMVCLLFYLVTFNCWFNPSWCKFYSFFEYD